MTDENKVDPDWKYAEKAMTWYGWGSPIGLGFFVVAIGVFILLLHLAGLW